MPMRDSAGYSWVGRESTYAEAGCMTVVTGLDQTGGLAAVGADAYARPLARMGSPHKEWPRSRRSQCLRMRLQPSS